MKIEMSYPAAGVRDGPGAPGARPVHTAAAQDHRRADDPYAKTGGYSRASHENHARRNSCDRSPVSRRKIQQWFTRGDGRGVIFLLNCKDVAEARALMESLPLSKENLMDEQFIPVGPLLPLGSYCEIVQPISELGDGTSPCSADLGARQRMARHFPRIQ